MFKKQSAVAKSANLVAKLKEPIKKLELLTEEINTEITIHSEEIGLIQERAALREQELFDQIKQLRKETESSVSAVEDQITEKEGVISENRKILEKFDFLK